MRVHTLKQQAAPAKAAKTMKLELAGDQAQYTLLT
jgi:hypothetical protein